MATRAVKNAISPPPQLPSYDDLPVRAGAPAGAAWGVFGDDDEVGTINLLTPERVIAATSSIRTGKVFALNLPINIPDPPLFTRGKHRTPSRFSRARNSCSTTTWTTFIRRRHRNGTRSRT